MKAYKYEDQVFNSEWELREHLSDVSFPYLTDENEQEICALLGVEIVNLPDPELSEEERLSVRKLVRSRAVNAIIVEVDGMKFDGDEVAQGRMARALKVAELNNLDKTAWVLADNTVVEVTKKQLEEALTKAMLQQATLWTKPYEDSDNEAS
ncbi:MAG: DUF4376 domain-containing protein [Sutterella wadsworthensis]|nr:DUF4376 domain-containing protein [Sutterella wadsworthensis]DAV25631.1 MAG TPA: protein of unknown function (DUF4376) [Caudoviricetes sp.]